MIPVNKPKIKPWLKWLLIIGTILLVAAGTVFWYVQTRKYNDTKNIAADYSLTAMELIHEFEQDNKTANEKYSDKIVAVSGIVSETEPADTTMNIKFIDNSSGSYIIFAFQKQHLAEAKTIKSGQQVTIKGACSGGIFSRLRKVTSITFQRSTLIQ